MSPEPEGKIRFVTTVEVDCPETMFATTSNSERVKNLEIQTLKKLTDQIAYLETERLAQEKTKDLFESGDIPTSTPSATTNLVAEFDLEVEKFRGTPQLYALLLKNKEVFGPLPHPQEACPLVQMNLIIKPEWKERP